MGQHISKIFISNDNIDENDLPTPCQLLSNIKLKEFPNLTETIYMDVELFRQGIGIDIKAKETPPPPPAPPAPPAPPSPLPSTKSWKSVAEAPFNKMYCTIKLPKVTLLEDLDKIEVDPEDEYSVQRAKDFKELYTKQIERRTDNCIIYLEGLFSKLERFKKDAFEIYTRKVSQTEMLNKIKNSKIYNEISPSNHKKFDDYIQLLCKELSFITIEINPLEEPDEQTFNSFNELNNCIDSILKSKSRIECIEQFKDLMKLFGTPLAFTTINWTLTEKRFESALNACSLDGKICIYKRLNELINKFQENV